MIWEGFKRGMFFRPYSWIEFTWNPLSSLERWVAVLGIVFMFLLTELNTFYLKFVLWWTPEHWINGLRLFFMLLWGSVCLRETFQLLDDPNCNKLGRQSWVLAAIIATEFLVCLKFGWDTLTKPIPRSVGTWWIAGVVLVVIYTVVKFIILKPTDLPRPETEKELLVNMTPVRRQKKKSREENGNILTRENGCQTEDGNPMSESEGKKFQ
jgi:phosphatidylserine synthase 2